MTHSTLLQRYCFLVRLPGSLQPHLPLATSLLKLHSNRESQPYRHQLTEKIPDPGRPARLHYHIPSPAIGSLLRILQVTFEILCYSQWHTTFRSYRSMGTQRTALQVLGRFAFPQWVYPSPCPPQQSEYLCLTWLRIPTTENPRV